MTAPCLPRNWTVAAALTIILAGTCWAADSSRPKPDPHSPYWFVKLGEFDAEQNLGLLEGATEEVAGVFGSGHRLGSKIWGEVEFGLAGRDHSVTPGVLPPGTDDPTLDILWVSYSFVGRFTIGRVDPFLGLGLGVGYAELEDAADIADGPFAPPDLEIGDEFGAIFHFRVGLDIAVTGRSYLGLEWRKTSFDADFGAFTNGSTDIGGTSALLTYKRTWGH